MGRSLHENDWDSPEAQWAGIRWMGASKQAFNGKRGQDLLRELEAALVALPSKRLIDHEWAAGGDVCTLAALDIQRMSARTGMNWDAARLVIQQLQYGGDRDDLEDYWEDIGDPAEFARERLGMTYTLAWEIIYENDQTWAGGSYLQAGAFHQITPEERYKRMLRWIRGKIHAGAVTTTDRRA